MTTKKPTLTEKVIPTKSEAKDTGLETIAIGAIPIGIAMIQGGQLESGVAVAAIGMASLLIKYKKRD